MISYGIPCYRSSQTIGDVVAQIREKMQSLTKYDYEIILVNDCSPDETFDVIKKMALEDARITAIDFARNFGQHSALMAGLRQTKGDIVICLDDDGQTPADEADKLLEALENGADVAYARYSHKKHSLFCLNSNQWR